IPFIDNMHKAAAAHHTVNRPRDRRKHYYTAACVSLPRKLFQDVGTAGIDDRYLPHSQNDHLGLGRNYPYRFLELAHRSEKERAVNLEDLDPLRNIDLRHITRPEFFVLIQRVGDNIDMRFLRHLLQEEKCRE